MFFVPVFLSGVRAYTECEIPGFHSRLNRHIAACPLCGMQDMLSVLTTFRFIVFDKTKLFQRFFFCILWQMLEVLEAAILA